jgi:hypothetical protein
MKTKARLDLLVQSFSDLQTIFRPLSTENKLVEIFGFMSKMTSTLVDKLVQKHKETKTQGKERVVELEKQLFTTKVETETLKIDKKYFEDQVSELSKKNQEMQEKFENKESKIEEETESKKTDAEKEQQ